MYDPKEFVSKQKSMLIAPAGYGKTHTIAECLNYTKENGRQLILTHTHSGIASIKEKIKNASIPSSSYNVETITSFAQKYVLAFYLGVIPEQSESKVYYPFIIEKAIQLFKIKSILNIILNTYSGLFVDEYQDCTTKQHDLILALSEILPTHILGDHLQGIFGFNGEYLVDMENAFTMKEFAKNKEELEKPWRWVKGNNDKLGMDLKSIRRKLIDEEEIDLNNFKSIEVNLINESELYDPKKDYHKMIIKLFEEKSLLIIHPDSTSINPRKKFVGSFNNRVSLLESIDDSDFYNLANQADLITKGNAILSIKNICIILFNKTGVGNWFNEKGLINKSGDSDKLLIAQLKTKINQLDKNISFSLVSEIIREIKDLPEVNCYRKELYYSFSKALEEADYNKSSVYDAMVNKRNSIRRMGRKIYGKCIGTTLLTKGLEFDTVAIINAHKFDCKKNLYVALTRACKRLIIYTNNPMLKPYKPIDPQLKLDLFKV